MAMQQEEDKDTAMDTEKESKETLLKRVEDLLAIKGYIKKTLHSHKQDLEAIRQYIPANHDDVLILANNIGLTHSAPKNWVEGVPLIKVHGPAPFPMEMRAGALADYNVRVLDEKPKGIADEKNKVEATKRRIEEMRSALLKRKYEEAEGSKDKKDMQVEDTFQKQSILIPATVQTRKVNLSFGFGDDSDDEED